MSFNPNFEAIGNAFVQHYYKTFDTSDPNARTSGLSNLYDPLNSYMTFEGVQVKGREAILQKFGSLPFQSIKRAITKTDCQPLPDGSIIVAIIGQLQFAFGVCVLCQISSLLTMRSMAKCERNEKRQVVDAGFDLNQNDSFGEYCKDVIILCCFLTLVGILWPEVYWLLLIIPAFAAFKVWTMILAPWFFSQSSAEEDDSKMARKKKKKYGRI